MDSRRLVPLLVGGVLAVIAAALLAIDAGGASIEAWAVLFGYGLLALIVAQLPSQSGASDSSRASTMGAGGNPNPWDICSLERRRPDLGKLLEQVPSPVALALAPAKPGIMEPRILGRKCSLQVFAGTLVR